MKTTPMDEHEWTILTEAKDEFLIMNQKTFCCEIFSRNDNISPCEGQDGDQAELWGEIDRPRPYCQTHPWPWGELVIRLSLQVMMMVNGINFEGLHNDDGYSNFEGLLSRNDENENTWRFPIIILLFLGFLSRGSPRMGGGGREGHREQGGELAWFRWS